MNTQQYSDCHFHTECSPDSEELLSLHIQSAQQRGITHLCVTDHWDLIEEPTTLTPPLEKWHALYQSVLPSLPSQMTLLFGVELGDGYHNIPVAQKVLDSHPLDFVLGSAHAINVDGGYSIYYGFQDCDTPEKVSQFFDDYFQTLLHQSEQTYYDSFGHIIYPFRYLPPDSPIQLANYMEQVTAILENLIKHDKAFELNTTQGKTMDIWTPILTRYHELGGTLLTIGSDAHRHSHIGLGIPQGIALLQSLGFTQYTNYIKRVPHAVPILS